MLNFLMVPVVLILTALMVMLGVILGAVIGAFSGWVVGHTPILKDLVVSGAHMLGLDVSASMLVPLGAFLGFVGGFFRAVNSNSKE